MIEKKKIFFGGWYNIMFMCIYYEVIGNNGKNILQWNVFDMDMFVIFMLGQMFYINGCVNLISFFILGYFGF